MEVSGQLHAPAALRSEKEPPGPILRIEAWADPNSGLNDVEKRKFLTLPGFELRPLDRSPRCQSLYRLRYLGSVDFSLKLKFL
jgi:hypothetical protein